jgi:hypothetical protein
MDLLSLGCNVTSHVITRDAFAKSEPPTSVFFAGLIEDSTSSPFDKHGWRKGEEKN